LPFDRYLKHFDITIKLSDTHQLSWRKAKQKTRNQILLPSICETSSSNTGRNVGAEHRLFRSVRYIWFLISCVVFL